jgi:Protein of unknown function (DUF3800)
VAIEKEKYIKKYGKLSNDPYEISLSFIIERAIFYLDESHAINLKIIIEKRGRKEDNSLNSHFCKLYANGTYFITEERMRQYHLELEFKGKLDNINGLQLADLIAYPIARYLLNKEGVNYSFEIVKNKFYSKNGINYGLKVFP